MAGAHLDSVQDGAGHQRQRLRQRRAAGDRDPDGEGQADQHGPVRLVGRRGGRPARLRALRRQLTEAQAERHRAVPQLRHGRLAELHVRHLRRRQLRRHRAARASSRGLGARSRTSSSSSTPTAASRSRTASSPAAPTTARSSRSASRPAACSPAPRCQDRAEAALYGGVAGAAYDPCYHQSCDNLTGAGQDAALYNAAARGLHLVGNINVHALDVNSDAIATSMLTFAYDTSTVNGVAGAPGRGQVKSDGSERTLATIRDQRTR